MRDNLKIFARLALYCVVVTVYAVLVVGLLWAMFAVEPGRGWSWPT